MRACSARSSIVDPYRAGLALGEELASVAPEVVFLFSSIHYASPELLEGLYDGLQRDEVIVTGNTGDGCCDASGHGDQGVAALGLNSAGAVRWRLEYIDGADALNHRLPEVLATLSADGEAPCLAYLAASFQCDIAAIETVLRDSTPFPVVGGLAGDDWRLARCGIYANRRLLDNGLAILAAYGSLDYSIAIGNTLRPLGRSGVLETTDAMKVQYIGGLSAMDFFERETGKPVLLTDHGSLALRINAPESGGEYALRSIQPGAADERGSLGLFGPVTTGYEARICVPNQEDLLADVAAIAADAARGHPYAAALLVSCASRKSVLGRHVDQEVALLRETLNYPLPLAGFFSFGEIGPLRHGTGYTRNLLHNMTYVLLLINA